MVVSCKKDPSDRWDIGRAVAAILVSINCQASVTYRPLAFKWMISGFRFPHTHTPGHTRILGHLGRAGEEVRQSGKSGDWRRLSDGVLVLVFCFISLFPCAPSTVVSIYFLYVFIFPPSPGLIIIMSQVLFRIIVILFCFINSGTFWSTWLTFSSALLGLLLPPRVLELS